MGTAFLVVLAALGVIGFFMVLLERIRALERRVADLAKRLSEAPLEGVAAAASEAPPQPVAVEEPQAIGPAAAPAAAAAVNRPPRPSQWNRAERSFARFWTGILGALALVIGFSFLAILTALRMGGFARFVMLVAISGLLYAGSLLAARRKRTGLFASWLKSASGALVLFGCFGSSAVPWLRWVASDFQGYAVLAAGVAINLVFALAGSQEMFASFHTLISLAALAVAPAQPPVLVVAVVVTGACSLPAFRRPWGLHLLLCTSSFFVFFAAWMMRQPLMTYAIESAAIGALVVAMGPSFVAPYLSPAQTPFGAAARGATWIYLATGVMLFSAHLPWISAVLLVLALTAYLLSRRSGARGRVWLVRLDGIAGVGLAVLAALGLVRIHLDLVFVVAVAYAATALVSADPGVESIVRRVCGALQGALGLTVIAVALASVLGLWIPSRLMTAGHVQVAAVVGVLAGVTALQLRMTRGVPPWVLMLLGGLYPALLAALYLIGLSLDAAPRWAALGGAVVVLGGVAGLALDRRQPTFSHRLGLVIVAGLCQAVSLVAVREIAAMGLAARAVHGLLLVAAAAVALAASWGPADRRRVPAGPGAALVVIALGGLALSATLGLDRAWTLLSWSAIVVGTRLLLGKAPAGLTRPFTVAAVALGLLGGVVAAALSGGGHPLRLAAEAAAVAAMLAWAREPHSDGSGLPLVALLALALLSVYVFSEAGSELAATALAAAAIAALVAGVRGPAPLRSLALFSILPYFASLASLAYLTGPLVQADLVILSRPWWTGVAAAVGALAYVGLFFKLADLKGLTIAGEPAWLRSVREGLARGRSLALFAPFYSAIGLFFAWSFGGPALTAIYIVTCFTVFALGIALKEPVFRPLSYGLLAYCLIRLVFFDMARADTFDRALVFIIAGAVLLGMNWLYNRFVAPEEKESSQEKVTRE